MTWVFAGVVCWVLERELLGVCRLPLVREAAGVESVLRAVLAGRHRFLAVLLRADARLETCNYRGERADRAQAQQARAQTQVHVYNEQKKHEHCRAPVHPPPQSQSR